MTGCGFADDIRDAVCDLYYGEEEILPYSELATRWDGEALMETLFDEMTHHIHAYDTRIITDNPYYQKVKPQAGQAGDVYKRQPMHSGLWLKTAAFMRITLKAAAMM